MTEPQSNPIEENPQNQPVSDEPSLSTPEVDVQAAGEQPEINSGLPDPAEIYPQPKKKRFPVWLIVVLAVILLLGAGFGGLRLLESSALDQAAAGLAGGDYAAAEAAANRALGLPLKALQAQPEQAYLLRGRALFHQGRLDEALQDLLTATQTYPQDADLQSALAHIYLAKGDLEAAYTAGATAKAADDSLALPYALDALKAYTAYQWTDALTAANAAVERGDDSGLALRIRGALALWVEDFATAKADLEKAAEQAPQDIEVHALRTALYTTINQEDAAIAAIEQVKAISSEAAVSLWAQAKVELYVKKNETAAAKLADQALALEKRPEFYLLRAQCVTEDSPEAEKANRERIEQALALMPDFFPALTAQTRQQMNDYELTDFESAIKRLEALAPKSYSTQLVRTENALLNYNQDDAVKYASLAVERAPDLALPHFYLSLAQQAHHEFDPAWQELETALKLDPDHNLSLHAAAMLALTLDEMDKAMGYADQILAAYDDQAEAHALKALLYHKDDKHTQANAELDKAEAIDPYDYNMIAARIQMNMDSDDKLTVLNDTNDLIKRKPNNPHYYVDRGWAYLYDENFDKARQDANKALDMNERLPDAYLLLAAIYNAEGSDSSALINADKSLEIDPFQTSPHLMKAQTYYFIGSRDKAVAETKSAANIAPWDDEIQFQLAEAYRSNGQVEEALPILEKLMEQKDDLNLDLLDKTETLLAFVKTVAPLVDGKRTQVDTEHHFSVTYPVTWYPEIPEEYFSYNDALFWVISTPSRGGHVGLKLSVYEIEGAGQYAASLWAYAVRSEIAEQSDGFQFFSSKTFRAAGMTGTAEDFQFEFEMENGDTFAIREKAYYFVKGDNLYVFEYLNTPENFDSKVAEVDEIVLTFSIPE